MKSLIDLALTAEVLLIAAITHHIWIHRAALPRAWRSVLSLVAYLKISWKQCHPSADTVLERKTNEIRITICRGLSLGASHCVFVGMMALLFNHLKGTLEGSSGHSNQFVSLAAICLIYYIPCRLICEEWVPLSISGIDVVYALFHMVILFRVANMKNDPGYFMFGPNRVLVRIVLAVVYMDVFKVVLWNVIVSFLICMKYNDNIDVLQDDSFAPSVLYANEFSVLIGIIFGCTCTAWVCKVCLIAQLQSEEAKLQAEDAHGAVRHMLTVLCDAVVRVDVRGNIIDPSPHFCDLVGLDSRTGGEEILFAQCLASEHDRVAVTNVLNAATTKGVPPVALHVNIHRSASVQTSAQVLFARLPDPQGKAGHLIGIREMCVVPREVESKTLEDPKADMPPKFRGRHPLSASSSASSRSSASRQKVALKEIDSVSISYDAFDPSLSLTTCSIIFAPKTSQTDRTLPKNAACCLRNLIHESMWNDFHRWSQKASNSLQHAGMQEKFSPVLLRWPMLVGEPVYLVAESVELGVGMGSCSDKELASDSDNSDDVSRTTMSQSTTLKLKRLWMLSGYKGQALLDVLQTVLPISEHHAEQ